MSAEEKPTPDEQRTAPESGPRLEYDPRLDKAAVEALKGPAIWEGPQGDVRIGITGYLGSYEGRPFFDTARGKEASMPVPLDEVRFSEKRGREIRHAGVSIEDLLQPPTERPDERQEPTDYSESPHEYERAYHAVPDKQKEHIVESAHGEANELAARAEELYRESELAKVRASIERSEKYGAKWTKSDTRKAEREAVANLDESPPKKFIDTAYTELRRPEELTRAVDQALAAEPEEERATLREEASRWVAFLEEHGEKSGVEGRADEAVESAKEFEKAFEESPHSPELKQELRENLHDSIERRAREIGDGRITAQALESAREWMLELVRTGKTQSHPETAQDEVLDYAKSRLKTWGKRLFGSKGRALLTLGVLAASVAVGPVGLVVFYGSMTAASLEALGFAYEAGKSQFEKEREKQEQRARERRIREQLGFA